MLTRELQKHLLTTRRYAGAIDGIWGRLSDAGVLLAMTDGPDTALTVSHFNAAGVRLNVEPAAIRAFWSVEANGAGFQQGRPKILPERHRFSKATGGKFDKAYPALSAPQWTKAWYPGTQDGRYNVLLQWCRLLSAHAMPIDAAFASCSYGAPQIMGENASMCGYPDPFTFAEAMARDENTQLRAFEAFVTKRGILPFLQRVTREEASWDPVALRYNGTGFRLNGYSGKMRAAYIKFGGRS
jgi:hypothetical protein